MEAPRTREPLSPGTIIRMPDGFCCQVTGPVISEGGGSLIYPVSRVRIDAEGVHRQEMEYALKECFPLSVQHRLCRKEDGTIVAEDFDGQAADFLAYVKNMQLAEQDTTNSIYHTAFRMVPILESAATVELSLDEGESFHAVQNAMTVMESLAGKGMTLQAFLEDNSRGVSALVALRIVQQVLYALREVHDAGYLHLDIQDGNILLQGNLDDGSIQATLIDFGCARSLQEDGYTASISDRALFSTRGFSAPEMARNDGTLRLGPQADLYSTGYLLLFLLTGTRYDSRSLASVRGGRVLTAMRMRHTQCPAHLQGSLQSLLQKALAQEPAERYATAEEMLHDVTVLADALTPKQSDLAAVAYDAFICYKHNERDDRAAAALRHALEHYRIPQEVQKAAGKERFDRVFLDMDELSSCANLGAAIHDALVSASWLIVVCSPETPQSPWVAQEIDTFLEHHDASHVLTVLTAGEPDESFPERLRATSRQDMMFAADARAGTVHDMEKAIRRDTVLRIAAPMLGVSYDALKQRRRAWAMRRGLAVLGIALAVALAFAAVMWQDNLRIQEEYANAQIRESKYFAQESQRQLFDEGNRLEAVRTALQALPSDERQRPYVAEAELALSEALRCYRSTSAEFFEASLDVGGEVTGVCISDDLRYITITSVSDDTIWVSTWDPHTGLMVWKKRLGDLAVASYGFTGAMFSTAGAYVKYIPGSDKLLVGTFNAVAEVDAGSGKALWNKELCTVSGNTIYGMLYDVVIPESEHPDTAYLFRIPENEDGGACLRIDAIDVESGEVRRSVDTQISVTWSEEGSFLVAPSQDYALVVSPREDGSSEYACVSLTDGSTVMSDKLVGLPMNAWVHANPNIDEDWFIATYQAGAGDETPGTVYLYRIEKAAGKQRDSGQNWVTELPMSHAWSKNWLSMGRTQLPSLAHSTKKTPTAIHLGKAIGDGESIRYVVATDRDIYTVDPDSGDILAHETAPATVVGYTWGEITTLNNTTIDCPYFYYADGGIDPFLITSKQSSSMVSLQTTNPGDNPAYASRLDDSWLLMVDADSSVENENVDAVVSADEPSVVRIIGIDDDRDKAVATIEPSEGYSFTGIYTDSVALSPRGGYLCVHEEPVSDNDDAAGTTGGSFVLYETQSWQDQARCEVNGPVDRMLGLTADGACVIWQEKAQDNSGTGVVYLTELASGQTEALPGLSAHASAHYAASALDAEDNSVLVAVLSYEDGKSQPYTARLYRDGDCTAELAFSLEREGNRVINDRHQRETPLAMSASGMLAFGYRADKATEVDVFVDMVNQTVLSAESPIISNNPSYACLSRDGARYASADSDGVVRVRDTQDGSPVCSYTTDGGIRALAFIADDRQLALYTDDYRLLALDAQSGEVVSETPNVRSKKYEAYLDPSQDIRKQISEDLEEALTFLGAYHDISIYETENDLILCTALGEGCIIDRESMTVRGYMPGIMGYSISANAVLVKSSGVFAYPILSVEDLVEEGEQLVSGYSPPAADGERE